MYEVTDEVKRNVRDSIERELSGVATVDECSLDLFVFKMIVKVDGWRHSSIEISNGGNGIAFYVKSEERDFAEPKVTLIKPEENFWRIVSLPPAYAQGIGAMIGEYIERVAETATKKRVSL